MTAPALDRRPTPVIPLHATPAERAVATAAATVDPIGLDELLALAELQTRVDRKYFVPAAVFRRLIEEFALKPQTASKYRLATAAVREPGHAASLELRTAGDAAAYV